MTWGNYGQTANVRRKVFVSYHHRGDQGYYDLFSRVFHDNFETITDNSLERQVDSADVNYIMRRIREFHLTGSSCTVVLCGQNTPYRKYVDWEIDASLDQGMGLIGVGLPNIVWVGEGTTKPARLQDNINSGYAEWVLWQTLVNDPNSLSTIIERALAKSARQIDNIRLRKVTNG
jgi:hypothetical protein